MEHEHNQSRDRTNLITFASTTDNGEGIGEELEQGIKEQER
jgi:hypothetical protein